MLRKFSIPEDRPRISTVAHKPGKSYESSSSLMQDDTAQFDQNTPNNFDHLFVRRNDDSSGRKSPRQSPRRST